MQSTNFSRGIVLGLILIIFIWLPLTVFYFKTVIHTYATTNLSMALLTTDSIFFGAIIVFMSILISKSYTRKTHKSVFGIVRKMRSLSIGVAILLIANISSYFTSGWIQSLAIYYQLWTTPAYMLAFYHLFGNEMFHAFNPKL